MELTVRAVTSVFEQTYQNIELIVVNDGSAEDDTRLSELLSGRKSAHYIKLEKNAGPGEARNAGIKQSAGRYIAFLDSDDTWEKEKLSIQMERMLRYGWSFSHTSYRRHDNRNGKVINVRSGWIHYDFPLPAFYCGIATPTVVLDRNMLSGESFRTDIRSSEDTLFWLALSKRMTLHGINAPLTNVFIGDSTTALDKSKQEQAMRLLANEGLKGHYFLLAVHALYRTVRKIQREISARVRP
jgi:glycosyltransferase involved in cell wall biosynthesis